jgi:hypothetical protein
MEEEKKTDGFYKNGQIKVARNPKEGIKKVAGPDEKEFGIDDLVSESIQEDEDGNNSSDRSDS